MKTKEEKKEIINKLKDRFEQAKSFILLDLTNLKAEIEKPLRDLLKEKQCQFEVVKKNLLYKTKKDFPFTDEELKKPFAILWDFQDGISVFKTIFQSKKELAFDFQILGGYFEGKKLSESEVLEIAKLPSREELLTKLAGSLINLPQRLAFSLKYPLQKLSFVVSSIKK